MRRIVLLFASMLLVTALAGCAGDPSPEDGDPGDGSGQDGGQDGGGPGGDAGGDGDGAGERLVQTYTGGFPVVSPFGCALVGGELYDGLVQDSTPVETPTRGGAFTAYINITTGPDLFVVVFFVDDDLTVLSALDGQTGEAVRGDVPAQATRAVFGACGGGVDASVWYQAVARDPS